MAVYTVHAPLREGATVSAQAERFVFVRDGFSFPALLFGALWMLRHRMWLVLLCYVLVTSALAIVLQRYGSTGVALVVWSLLALLIGFEAPTLRRFTLGRRGFRTVGLVVGDDIELAERRFFDAWVQKQDAAGSGPFDAWTHRGATGPAQAPSATSPAHGPDVLGLFPEPGAAT
jgi:hypothetical protein